MTTLNPIEIFRPGRHTAAAGQVLKFSDADLVDAARVYDPALYRAPLVVGHPKTDDLAYGHVAALTYSDTRGRLVAEPADVEVQFADLVDKGRLLAVSAAFYTPTSPNNPAPGHYYLRHVGFLGAEAPAVKGLARPTVAFSETEEGVIEFSGWQDSAVAGLLRGLREWVIGKFGLDEAEKALPSWSVQSLADAAVREQVEDAREVSQPVASGLSYSEGNPVTTVTQEQLAAQAAQLATDRAALDARAADVDKRERAATHAARLAEFSDFTAGLVLDGRMLPQFQPGLVAVLASLPDAQVVEFSEGDAAVNKPAVQVLREYLSKQPKFVEFKEVAGAGAAGAAAADVDLQDGQAIAKAAVEFRDTEAKAGRTVSLEAAVQHIVTQHKEA